MKNNKSKDLFTLLAKCFLLLSVVALGTTPLFPPIPMDILETPDFSVHKAFQHIEQIAQVPHPIGTAANKQVREYIISQLQTMGLEAEIQVIEAYDYFSATGGDIEVINVMARIPGSSPSMAVALAGHYDTTPFGPGANDDSSAVAIILEAARVIQVSPQLKNDVILLFIDGEEPAPRFGSSPFVNAHPWAGDIGFVINLEAIGSGGPSTLIGMNGPSSWVFEQYADNVPYPTAFSFLTTIYDLIGGSNSDFAEFRNAGIPGVELAYLTGSPIYHTMDDSMKNVSERSLLQQGTNAIALTRHMGNLEISQIQNESNSVFFTLGRYYVVRYHAAWSLLIVIITAVILILTIWRQSKRLQILFSLAVTFLKMNIAAVIGFSVWTFLAGLRSTMSIFESYLYLVGLLILTGVIEIFISHLIKRKVDKLADAAGVVLLWWLFGLLTSILAPGISYLFVWPALAGGLALLFRSSQTNSRWKQSLSFALVSGTSLVLVIPAINYIYQFAQPRPGNLDSQILFTIAIPIMLFSMVFVLIRVFWKTKEMNPMKTVPMNDSRIQNVISKENREEIIYNP
jgi:hypothetical protein